MTPGTASALTPESFNNFGELLRFLRERRNLQFIELDVVVSEDIQKQCNKGAYDTVYQDDQKSNPDNTLMQTAG